MGKRYTYFRKPDGKPYKGNDGKYAPVNILSEIGKTAQLNSDGAVSWSAFSIERLLVALRPALAVVDHGEVELNETDAWDLIWKTIVALAKSTPGKPLNHMEVLKNADKSAAEFFAPPHRSMCWSRLCLSQTCQRRALEYEVALFRL